MHNFRELKVWQKAMDLTVELYQLLAGFPEDEKYGLISQLRRAAVSVPSNIAEGAGRNSKNEFRHFLSISLGSLFEIETQLILSNRLHLIDSEALNNIILKIVELQKMVSALQRTLNE